MARNLLDIELPGIQFEVALHLATLLSVFVVYRAPVKELCLGYVKGDSDTLYYLFMLIIATLPAAFIGLWANEFLERLFLNPWVTIRGFMTTSLVLWSIHVLEPSQNNRARVTVFTAAMIGLAQAFKTFVLRHKGVPGRVFGHSVEVHCVSLHTLICLYI